jgi:hypothetical protein
MNTEQQQLRTDLQEIIDKLGKAAKRVDESAFRLEHESPDELNDDPTKSTDVLIGRFLRLSYVLIARAIPMIDRIDGLDPVNVSHSLARATERGLIENAGELFALPIVRNEFSDEYESYEPEQIGPELLRLTPSLLNSVERTRVYGISLLALAN